MYTIHYLYLHEHLSFSCLLLMLIKMREERQHNIVRRRNCRINLSPISSYAIQFVSSSYYSNFSALSIHPNTFPFFPTSISFSLHQMLTDKNWSLLLIKLNKQRPEKAGRLSGGNPKHSMIFHVISTLKCVCVCVSCIVSLHRCSVIFNRYTSHISGMHLCLLCRSYHSPKRSLQRCIISLSHSNYILTHRNFINSAKHLHARVQKFNWEKLIFKMFI
jgi:hypothetical protein